MRIFRSLVCLAALWTIAAAAPIGEVESLLSYIGSLEGAQFIRNGDAHTAKEAEAHLRMKFEKQKGDIPTAEDFIRLCGTKSSVSGKPYMIRFKDGHEEECAVVLRRQLEFLRSQVRNLKGAPNDHGAEGGSEPKPSP